MDERFPQTHDGEHKGMWQTYGGGIKELATIAVEASLRSIGDGLTRQFQRGTAQLASDPKLVALQGDELAGTLAGHPTLDTRLNDQIKADRSGR